jgi:hypothetical protein
MADRLTAIRARFGPALEAAGRRSFWIVLPLAAMGLIVVAGVLGSTAMLRAEAWRIRANEIRATGETVAAWREDLVPASPAESAAWERSARAVRGYGIDAADRIALMQLVAQRAEDLGIGPVAVAFVAADTLAIDVFREVDGRFFDPAPYALRVGFTAPYAGIASFIGALPPQVDVHRLTVARDDEGGRGGVRADLVLVVFLDGGG